MLRQISYEMWLCKFYTFKVKQTCINYFEEKKISENIFINNKFFTEKKLGKRNPPENSFTVTLLD